MYDYKKECKQYYLPTQKPAIVEIPSMNFLAVAGKGDPNEADGEYSRAMGLLYGVAYTVKMSYKGDYKIAGFFEYVVPPLEGFWWQTACHMAQTHQARERAAAISDSPTLPEENHADLEMLSVQPGGVDYSRKADFRWISLIRLPDFVTEADFEWAVKEATRKKKTDFSEVRFLTYDEGLCVQSMHLGAYDDEPATVAALADFAHENGYVIDITPSRYHHEIYLTDPRKTEQEKLKTVVRHPIRRAD